MTKMISDRQKGSPADKRVLLPTKGRSCRLKNLRPSEGISSWQKEYQDNKSDFQLYGTLPHPATRPLKTHSMAVRAIPLPVCHQGPLKGYRTGFKKCSDAQQIYSANSCRWHKCKSGWSLKTERSIVNDCIHWYYSYNTASISDMN